MGVGRPSDPRGATRKEGLVPSIAADRLATVFVEVADTLTAEFDLVDFMQMLSRRCAELANVAAVGLLLADNHGRLQFIAASDEQTALLELFQLQAEQGPCLDCYHTGRPVMYGDLAGAATPWPAFAKEAQAGGFRSVHAIPLRCASRPSAH